MLTTCIHKRAAEWLTLVALIFSLHAPLSAQIGAKKGDLHTQEIELHSVIEYYSSKTGKIILPNDGVLNSLRSRKATIVVPKNFTQANAEMYDQIFEGILKIYGYTLTKQGSIYRLTTIKDSWKLNLPINKKLEEGKIKETSERIVIQVIVLKHVTIDSIRQLFKYVSDITPPMTLLDKKTLIVTTHESNLKNFLKLLEILDVPAPPDETIIVSYPLKRASATQIRSHIQAYFNVLRARNSKTPVDPTKTPFFLVDDTSNRLLVSATPRDHETIQEFIRFFEDDPGIENEVKPMEIYKLKNSDAESLSKILNQVLKGKLTAPSIPGNTKAKPKQEEYSLVAYKELNALIISVDKKETMKIIKEVIELLDVKRKQVLIRSTIIEVNNSSSFNFGTDFGLKSTPANSSKIGLGIGSSLGTAGLSIDPANSDNPVTLAPDLGKNGLQVAVPYGRYDVIPFVLNMAESDSNINVLATPSIICDDNEKALIEITEERSFTTTTVSGTGTPITSQGGFNEAGIVLQIKPTISSDQFLKLDIEQNVDRFIPNESGRDVRNKRKATTIVTIPNNTSVVFGGLTERTNDRGAQKIPGLSKIPLVGKLFQNTTSNNNSNTLYFFITPQIITSFDELNGITDRYHDELKRSADDTMKNDEIFKNVRNDKFDYDEEAGKLLGGMFEVFNQKNMKKWLRAGVYDQYAGEIMLRRNKAYNTFFPTYSQIFFDKSKLDPIFYTTLEQAHETLSKFKNKPKKHREILTTFDFHIMKILNNLSNRAEHVENRRRRKGDSASNLVFKVEEK